MVEERVPGKQGLKQECEDELEEAEEVEERVPGKQGLKQVFETVEHVPRQGRRASSRKTRIETCVSGLGIGFYVMSKSEFQENKD